MLWTGSSVREWFWAFVIVSAIGVFTTTSLRLAGWSWWSRIIVTIPIVALAARIASKILSNTIIIF